MNEAINDEIGDPVNGTHIRKKETEFSLKPDSSNMLQSNEMVTPGADDYPEIPKKPYSDILDAKDIDRIGSSEHASASPRCMDDVQELTLRNYDGENMTIVGTSNNRERMQTSRNQWQHLYQIAGGSGIKGKGQATSSVWEESGNNLFSGLLDQTQPLPKYNHNTVTDNLLSNDDKTASGNHLFSSGGIRTKILSKSGFSEYFIKSTLRGKGVIHKSQNFRASGPESGPQGHPTSDIAGKRVVHENQGIAGKGVAHENQGIAGKGIVHENQRFAGKGIVHENQGITGLKNSVAPLSLTAKPASPLSRGASEQWSSRSSNSGGDGINLRDWLERVRSKTNKIESMHIFRQVLDLVDFSHSRGVFIQELRPSYLKLSKTYQVVYLGSSVRVGTAGTVSDEDISLSNHNQSEKRPIHHNILPLDNHSVKKRKLGENMNIIRRWPQFPARSGIRSASINVVKVDSADSMDSGNDVDEGHDRENETKNQRNFSGDNVPKSSQPLQASVNRVLEEKWYTCPEVFNGKGCTFASNIYCLGILLFELLGSFDCGRSHAAAMLDLRHRILPPSFLSENPKEAGFCLWLLHPEPSLRPTTRAILQSEFISEIQELSGNELLPSINEEDVESELLLHFLSSLSEQKQKDTSNLVEQIQSIEADIQEVEKRRPKNRHIPSVEYKDPRLMSSFSQLETAYFSMKSTIQPSDNDFAIQRDGELLKSCGNSIGMGDKYNTRDRLGGFFDGLCKYARYSKFEAKGIVRNGEFSNSANVICSLSFDRDEDYLATGGVSKKIKIFEFQALFNDAIDVHYPVVEMTNKSKLSCVCWNSYIRNYLASTDYDGIVKLWDASTGQGFSQFTEHTERAWSVDFSRVDPTKLASGSDDRLVKVWNINDRKSVCTIRNNANVCSVQFSADSTHLLGFSTADYKTYCYDLRNISTPWCILAGHEKAVSYAKFLDAGTLVTASTDNTLKIWDLNKTSSNSLSRDACILTLRGHTNEKNFVGLSVADGYITCGSETNEVDLTFDSHLFFMKIILKKVFAYYKSLPMPITSHKFGSIDPVTGKESEDDNGQFISSVCWRRKSNMVVAANSSGCIKMLQMV